MAESLEQSFKKKCKSKEQIQARVEIQSLNLPTLEDFTIDEILEYVTNEVEKFEVENYETLNPLPELGDQSDVLGAIEDDAFDIKGRHICFNKKTSRK